MPEYIIEGYNDGLNKIDEQTVAGLQPEEVQKIIKLIEHAKMPQWWIDYAEQLAYNLQVHTKGLMFDKVTGLYPNEHPESQKHCINSYESITKGSIWKAINNIIRVFNNSSYNIQISDKTKTVLEEYENSEGSLFSQFLEDWIRYAVAEDPNGICVTYPPEYTDDLYRYVCYKDLVKIGDEVLIFKSEHESEIKIEYEDKEYTKEVFIDYDYMDIGGVPKAIPNVRHGSMRTFNRRIKKSYVNTVFHVFTKEYFIRLWKENKEDTKYQYKYYKYLNELETLPYFYNGGVEIESNYSDYKSACVYESFVQQFVPFGNLALMSHRNQRAVDLMFSYPAKAEVQQPCDECHAKGQTPCATSTTGWETCKICKGSKFVTIQSPYKVYRKVHDSFDVDGKVFSTPSVEYYTPDIGMVDYNNKRVKQHLSEAEQAVFVQQKIETGNTEAAKSKEIDREELYSWLANISKVLYGNMQMFLQYLENYINPSPIQVSVEMPYSFAILTESEAFEALNAMLTSPAPVSVKASQIDNFINKFISESSPVKRAFQILKKYDLLLYYSDDSLASYKGMGTISNQELIKHQKAYPLLIQMYEKDNKLFDLEDEAIIVKLDKEMKQYDLTAQLRTTVLNAITNNQDVA